MAFTRLSALVQSLGVCQCAHDTERLQKGGLQIMERGAGVPFFSVAYGLSIDCVVHRHKVREMGQGMPC